MRATPPLSLENENAFTSMLVQAMLGAVSPNFRAVAISFAGSTWEIQFVLERDDETDREEIQDVVNEFDALISGYEPSGVQLTATVAVNTEPLPILDPSTWRAVFRRREV